MAKTRKKRGEAALRSAAETIRYEVQMFQRACLELNRVPAQDTFTKNFLIEVILLHARNIRDFFAPTGHDDDILARDFVVQLPRIALPYLRSESVRRRINKLLSHPSYSRRRLTRTWNLRRLCSEVTTAWNAFLSRLARDNPVRYRWFVKNS